MTFLGFVLSVEFYADTNGIKNRQLNCEHPKEKSVTYSVCVCVCVFQSTLASISARY